MHNYVENKSLIIKLVFTITFDAIIVSSRLFAIIMLIIPHFKKMFC